MHGIFYFIGTESDSASAMDDEDSFSEEEGHKDISQQLPRIEDQADGATITAKDDGE